MMANEAVEKPILSRTAGRMKCLSAVQLLSDQSIMARYKVIDTSPRFLAVDLQQQLVAEHNGPNERGPKFSL